MRHHFGVWFIWLGGVDLLHQHIAMALYVAGIVAWLYLQIKWHGLMCVSYIHNAITKALPYINSNPSHSLVALRMLPRLFPLEIPQQHGCWSRRAEYLRYTWKHDVGPWRKPRDHRWTVGKLSQPYLLVDKKFPVFGWDFGEGLRPSEMTIADLVIQKFTGCSRRQLHP